MALDSTVKVKFLGDAANLAREAARASKATDAVGRSAENAHSHLSKMAKGFIAGASIGAAFYGVEKAVKSSVNAYKDAAGEASKLSRLTGLAAEDASRLGFAAKETGVESETFAKSLGILSKNLNSADKAQTVLTKTHHLAIEQVPRLVKGHIEYVSQLKNVTDVQKTTKAGTQSLGFALRDATGHLLPMSELLPKIADKFKNMADGPEKTALALKLFGRGGAALLPFLNKGAEGLAAFSEEADKLGITMSTKDVAAYRSYIASQRQFKAAIEGVKISLGRELFPVFASWSQALADNGPKLAGYARELGEKIGPAAQRAATAIKDLVQGFKDGTGTGGQIRDVLVKVRDVVKWFADHPDAMKGIATSMVIYAAAAKSAALWSAAIKLAPAAPAAGAAGTAVAAGAAGAAGLAVGTVVATSLAITAGLVYLTNRANNNPQTKANTEHGTTTATIPVPGADKHKPITFTGPDGKTRQYNADGSGPVGTGSSTPYHRHDPQVPDDYDAKTHATPAQRTANASKRAAGVAADAAAATRAAAQKTADANKAALDKELATAAAAQKVADAKAAAAEALQQATDKLRDALQSRLDMAKGIRDNLVGSNSIIREGVSFTAKDLLSRFQVTVAKVKRFQAAISQMVHKGFSTDIVQQAAQAGIGSLGAVEGLARANAGQVRQANALQTSINTAAGRTGDRVASQMGPITFESKVMLNDKVLATAVNTWNARNGYNGSRLAS